MNRSILTSLLSIGLVLSLVTGVTLAFFSDQGTSTGNTFSTGTLNLKLTDNNETAQDNVTASFGGSSLVPGSCTGSQTLELQNTGTVAANHAEVHVANVVSDSNEDASPDMHTFLRLQTLTYDGGDVLDQVTDLNSNGFKDLANWEASATALDNLGLTNLNTNHPLVMNVCLDESATNPIQGDSVTSTFTVDLNQDSSQ